MANVERKAALWNAAGTLAHALDHLIHTCAEWTNDLEDAQTIINKCIRKISTEARKL